MSGIYQLNQATGSVTLPSSGNTFIGTSTNSELYSVDSSGTVTVYGTGSGGGGSIDTGSLLTTASVSSNTITFTKGDGSTFPILVDTGSATSIDTGSFAVTASNSFTGSQTISGSVEITGSVNSNVTDGVRSQGLIQITDDDTASILSAYNATGSINGLFLNSGSDIPNVFVGTTEIPSFGGLAGGGFSMNSGSSIWSAGGQYTLGGTFSQLYYDPNFGVFGGNENYLIQVGNYNGFENALKIQKSNTLGEGIQLKASDITEGFVLGHSFSNSSASLFKVKGSGSGNTIFDITEVGTIAYRPIGTHNTDFTCSNSGTGYGGHYIRVTGNITCSLQPNSAVSVSTGVEWEFFQTDAAQLHFESASGVTLNSKDGALKLTGQFSAATLKKVGTDEWDLIGDLS